MQEIRVHGRFGQPVGKVVTALGRHAQKKGKHVQIFNSFAAYRPGGPMFAVIRTDDAPVRLRSTNSVNPDIVVILDNSLFASQDLIKGLKPGGIVMAAGIGADTLGNKASDFKFIPLDPFLADRSMQSVEAGLIAALDQCGAL
jgi:pyruvate ferredoxin oxidoreductase gamma subunit